MPCIQLAVTVCAFAIFPRLAPVNRAQSQQECGWRFSGIGKATTLLQDVLIGTVVIEPILKPVDVTGDEIRLGWVEVTAGGIAAE